MNNNTIIKKPSQYHTDVTNRIARLSLFVIFVYVVLQYCNSTEIVMADIIKLTGLLTMGFVLLDTYLPRIDFD